MSKLRYKYCVVPDCKSTTAKTPNKLFFSIPTGEVRKKWCEVMGRDSAKCKPLAPKCNRFCCEDHFNLEEDMENYRRWKLVGSKKLILKKGVLPHKFDCQEVSGDSKTSEQKNKTQKVQDISAQKHGLSKSVKNSMATSNTKRKNENENEIQNIKRIPSKADEKGKIVHQIKKIEKILQLKPETETTPQETQAKDLYTFHIKVEADEDSELSDTFLEKFENPNYSTANRETIRIGDIEIKVEELDEEFEPILVDEKSETLTTSENIEKENADEMETLLIMYDSDQSDKFVIEHLN